MVKEIQASYTTGATLYALLFNTSGQVRDVDTPEWETFVDASYGTYDIAMAEEGIASGIYTANMAASISAGVYNIVVRKRVGGSPAVSDPVVGDGQIHWDGTNEVPIGSNVVSILADTGTDGVLVATAAKTGYKLAADGLDSVTASEPSGKPTTFPGWIMWLIQRFRRSTLTSTTLTVKQEDGDVVTEQTVSDDGTTQSLGVPTEP